MSYAPEPPPTSSSAAEVDRSTCAPSSRAVNVDIECIASQNRASSLWSSLSNRCACSSGFQLVGDAPRPDRPATAHTRARSGGYQVAARPLAASRGSSTSTAGRHYRKDSGGHATVDRDHGAGHVRGAIAQQPGGGFGDLSGLAAAAERRECVESFSDRRVASFPGGDHVGVGRAGGDRVDSYPVSAVVVSGRRREADDCSFGGRVCAEVRAAS
jgi:hypothetical protein